MDSGPISSERSGCAGHKQGQQEYGIVHEGVQRTITNYRPTYKVTYTLIKHSGNRGFDLLLVRE